MDKSEIHTNQINGEDRQLKGLQDKGQINFECADCGTPLLVLQLATIKGDNESKILTRIAVQCGLCGGCSYVQQISGSFYPGAPNDDMMFDIVDGNIDELLCKLPMFVDTPEVDVLFKAWTK